MKPSGDQSILEMRAEIFRLARLCAPDLAALGNITFDGNPHNDRERRQWRDAVFLPVLVPAADAAWLAAKQGCREMLAADAALDAKLAGPLAKRSRAAGRLAASSLHAPTGELGLAKFLAAINDGSSPGHFTTVFAARASIFHFPKHIVLPALVFIEMRAARLEALWDIINDCIDASRTAVPSIFQAA